ncbi:MAG: hypothetical protein JWM80_4946 [Cyanobacteria bacterium RYN_339]|nr:hypothetical protein [Cyanobacteria bacterium RYN_339]
MSPIDATSSPLNNAVFNTRLPALPPKPLDLRLPANFGADSLALSNHGRLAAERQAKALLEQAFDQKDGPGPVSIQALTYTDRLSGRDSTLVFGADPGQVVPPVTMPPWPTSIDPRTGQPDLQLKDMRLRLNLGRYDLMVSIDGNGRPHLGKVFQDGRAVPELLRDALRGRIEEDPAVWGSLAGAVLVGAGVAAASYAKKSGKDVDFDLGRMKLLSGETYQVKAKLLGEFQGGSGKPGLGGVELGASYKDGPWTGSVTAKERRGRDPEYGLSASYEVSKTARWVATASYDGRSRNTAAYVGFNASF